MNKTTAKTIAIGLIAVVLVFAVVGILYSISGPNIGTTNVPDVIVLAFNNSNPSQFLPNSQVQLQFAGSTYPTCATSTTSTTSFPSGTTFSFLQAPATASSVTNYPNINSPLNLPGCVFTLPTIESGTVGFVVAANGYKTATWTYTLSQSSGVLVIGKYLVVEVPMTPNSAALASTTISTVVTTQSTSTSTISSTTTVASGQSTAQAPILQIGFRTCSSENYTSQITSVAGNCSVIFYNSNLNSTGIGIVASPNPLSDGINVSVNGAQIFQGLQGYSSNWMPQGGFINGKAYTVSAQDRVTGKTIYGTFFVQPSNSSQSSSSGTQASSNSKQPSSTGSTGKQGQSNSSSSSQGQQAGNSNEVLYYIAIGILVVVLLSIVAIGLMKKGGRRRR